MYNQNYPGYYPNNNGGYAYGVARPQPNNPQVLTEDQANSLRQKSSEFDMKIDQITMLRAICAHRDPSTGAMTLIFNDDGTCTCSICGETFRMFDGDAEDVKNAVNAVKDIMQTTKILYMDAPRTLNENYYQQIALLDKLVGLWKHSVNNFAKYENINNPLNPISGSYNGFGALNTLLTAPMYYGQQPMYGGYNPNMNPMGFNQTMMPPQQAVAAPMAPAAGIMPNQTMYGAYDPNMNPMGFNPQMMPPQQAATAPMAPVQQATAPAAPAPQNNEVQQQKVYNV